MGVNDLWHLTDAREGQPKCRQHNKVPSRQHGKGKRWEVRKGKFRQAFDRYADAKEASDNLGKESNPQPQQAQYTFESFCQEWYAKYNADPATKRNAEQTIRIHILPYLNGETLKEISDNILFWRNWVHAESDKYMRSTVQKHHTIVKQILRTAVMAQLISVNPLDLVKPLRPNRKQIEPWSADMVRSMRDCLPVFYKAIIDVGTVGGLRAGEIAGLAITDLDDSGHIFIRRQVQHINKQVYFKLPKHSKTRRIPVPNSLIARIKEHIREFGTHEIKLPNIQGELEAHPLIFVSPEGYPLYGPLLYNVWSAAQKEAGIPRRRENGPHAMRHYCASIALYNGVDLKTLSVYLGHESVATTAKYYTHLVPQGADDMRNAMQSIL